MESTSKAYRLRLINRRMDHDSVEQEHEEMIVEHELGNQAVGSNGADLWKYLHWVKEWYGWS